MPSGGRKRAWICLAGLLVAALIPPAAVAQETPSEDPIVNTWKLAGVGDVTVTPTGGASFQGIVSASAGGSSCWMVGRQVWWISGKNGNVYSGEHMWFDFSCSEIGRSPATFTLSSDGSSVEFCGNSPVDGHQECYTAVADPPDIELTALEVTQGIQDLNNSVPLIGSRNTFVRAHVKSSTEDLPNIAASLKGTEGSNALSQSPLKPINGSITVRADPKRDYVNHSFLFRLPPSWTLTPNVTLEFELDTSDKDLGCKDTGNDCKESVTFGDEVEADIVFYGMPSSPGKGPHSGWAAHVAWQMKSILPVSRIDWEWHGLLAWDPLWNPGLPSATTMLDKLETWQWWDSGDCGNALHTDCFYALITDKPLGVEGVAYSPGDALVAHHKFSRVRPSFTASHELGHATGRPHTACSGTEKNPDPNYPYPGGRISNAGDGAFMGLDTYGFVKDPLETYIVFDPDTRDLMSYCDRIWISDWTYIRIWEALKNRFGTTPLRAAQALESIGVAGTVGPGDADGAIETILQAEIETSPEVPGAEYSIVLLGEGGVALEERSFEASYLPGEAAGRFQVAVPALPGVVAIELRRGDQVLDSTEASASPPTVQFIETLVSPKKVSVSWDADDGDGDALVFHLFYSSDGGSGWVPVATDLSASNFDVGLSAMAGTDQGMLKVVASDGFHSAEALSDPFSVPSASPSVAILEPQDGAVVTQDSMVAFDGSAYDPEEGLLEEESLGWESDRDGVLGTGESLLLDAAALSPGVHTITFTASDVDGNTGEASIHLTVYAEETEIPTCAGQVATIVGSASPDVITGTPEDDVIVGLSANDRLKGGGGDDVICGNGGKDELIGGAGNDSLLGGGGNDVLKGGAGDDALEGGRNKDRCFGGLGVDAFASCEKKSQR